MKKEEKELSRIRSYRYFKLQGGLAEVSNTMEQKSKEKKLFPELEYKYNNKFSNMLTRENDKMYGVSSRTF